MAEFEQQMAVLRSRFQQRCRETHAELTSALDGDDRVRITAIAHAIAGNAGIFGYSELSRAAQELEREAEGTGGALLSVRATDVLEELERASRSSV